MRQTSVTVVGHVATEPLMRRVSNGTRVTSFRLASTERHYDKGLATWRDGDTTFFTVTAWRGLAENVARSLVKGQPVVVHGRLKDSSYDKDGQRRFVIEIVADAVGHDLSRGTAVFTKTSGSSTVDVVRDYDELTGEILTDGFPGDLAAPAALDRPGAEGVPGAAA